MFGLGPCEILIVAFLIVMLFVPKQLPRFARGMGDAIKEWKKVKNETKTLNKEIEL